MLAAGAAEAVERIAGDVIAALHGDFFLIASAIVGDRDLEENRRRLPRRCARRRCARRDRPNCARTASASSGSSRLGPKDMRGKNSGMSLPVHHIRIGHRQRAAAPVAGGSGIGAGGIGADPPAAAHRRNAGSSRHPPRRCGSASSAPACARPRLPSRRRARIRRHICATSVEVPPMSKPITLAEPGGSSRLGETDHARRRGRRVRHPCPETDRRR